MHVYEKPDGISAWLLRFIALREWLLDDKLLPVTSNAVERGNRRHRKMQKRVYRVCGKTC